MHFVLLDGGDFYTQAFFCARIIPAAGIPDACFIDTPAGRTLVVGDLATISAALALEGSTVVSFPVPGGGVVGITAQIICGISPSPPLPGLASSPECTYIEQVGMTRTVVLGTPASVFGAFGP